jgi:hypothetical protein
VLVAFEVGQGYAALQHLVLGLNDDVGVKGDRLHQDAHGGGSDPAIAGSVHGALGVQGEAELLDVLHIDDAGD